MLLALWGGFPAESASCQRIIGRAAARCATTAWRANRSCQTALLAGQPCDAEALRATVTAAQSAALSIAERRCVSPDISLLQMGFASILDVHADITFICRQLEDALVSVVYGPAMRGAANTEEARTCIGATAAAASRLLSFGFRDRRHVLDRIATADMGPSQKERWINRSTARIQSMTARLEPRVRTACPRFQSIYGRPAASFLRMVAQRADCLVGRTYVQDRVACPLSVCGNGMHEAGEACDDGNVASGDGCDSGCNLEATR